jgi:hypothetical protein
MIKTNSRGKGFRSAFVSLIIVVLFIVIAIAVFLEAKGKEMTIRLKTQSREEKVLNV